MEKYKIRLDGGRILGPIDVDRIRQLILKNHIRGTEVARSYPHGEWRDINAFQEIAEMLILKAQDLLTGDAASTESASSSVQLGETKVLAGSPLQEIAATQVLEEEPAEDPEEPIPDELLKKLKHAVVEKKRPDQQKDEKDKKEKKSDNPFDRAGWKIEGFFGSEAQARPQGTKPETGTEAVQNRKTPERELRQSGGLREVALVSADVPAGQSGVSSQVEFEKTIIMDRPGKERKKKQQRKQRNKNLLRVFLVGIVAVLFVMQNMESPVSVIKRKSGITKQEETGEFVFVPVKIELPQYEEGQSNPELSQKLYVEGLKKYALDTVSGYKAAATYFHRAVSTDPNNARALALLASAYMNLFDASKKDESYFNVISKLIELARAKAKDAQETVIADVEFYLTVNRPEAAVERIVLFYKANPQIDISLRYYLALSYYARGDYQNAARYLNEYPTDKIFSAKIYYLKGLIAEALGDQDSAFNEYRSALKLNSDHVKSRLKTIEIQYRRGSLKETKDDLITLFKTIENFSPKELAVAFFMKSQFFKLNHQLQPALKAVESALRFDRSNPDYRMEFYTLRGEVIGSDPASTQQARSEAKMYAFLREGSRLMTEGKLEEAQNEFVKAREANFESPTPLMKLGELFYKKNDIAKARDNYKLAVEKAPKNPELLEHYVQIMIESYEWDEAKNGIDRLRALGGSLSTVDKLTGDLYAKQGFHAEAQTHYKRALSRDSIDPEVYIALAKSLTDSGKYRDVANYYAFALQFDPLRAEAIVGTAKSVAATESIDRGIVIIEDALHRGQMNRCELLTALAEFQLQKGDVELAKQTVQQAMNANPDHALPWRTLAKIEALKEGKDKKATDRVLEALSSYIARAPADASVILERYQIYMRRGQFYQAKGELLKVADLYPHYPGLKILEGNILLSQKTYKEAVDKFREELTVHPRSVDAMLALGTSLIEMKDPRGALSWFTQAMQVAPKSPAARSAAGEANFVLRSYTGAVALFKSAISLDPSNPIHYKRLGKTYEAMGDDRSAGEAFKKYLQLQPDAPDRELYKKYL